MVKYMVLGAVMSAFTIGYMIISGKPSTILILCSAVQLSWIAIAFLNCTPSDFSRESAVDLPHENCTGALLDRKFGFELRLLRGVYSIIDESGHSVSYNDPQTAMYNWAKTRR